MDEEKNEMTPETKPQPKGVLRMEKDGTSYIIGLYSSETASETLEDKVKRLIQQEVKEGKV
jgi:hypothetical protein